MKLRRRDLWWYVGFMLVAVIATAFGLYEVAVFAGGAAMLQFVQCEDH